MKSFSSCKAASLVALVFGLAILAACGDDDSFSPVAKNRGYDYAFVKTNEFAEYPCNEMREGREAVVGRDKDRYECIFDERDSVYLWAGESDTLTAKGGEFVRAESSSSEEESSDSEDSSSDSEGSSSSRYSSSSSRYSSSSYSSSSRYSSSSYYFDTTWIFNKDYIDQTSIPFTLTSKDELLIIRLYSNVRHALISMMTTAPCWAACIHVKQLWTTSPA